LPAEIEMTGKGDDLKRREHTAASAAVDHLKAALDKMTEIRDNGGRKLEVMEKSTAAYRDTEKAQQVINEVHQLRANQK
jgi:hypothetical protein